MNTDGCGSDVIMIPDGGCRNMVSEESFAYSKCDDGVLRNRLNTIQDGAGVFAFAINKAPKSIRHLMEAYGISSDSVDYFLLHQANKAINDKIVKKLHIDSSKAPTNLAKYGNTSSASIPLLVTSELGGELASEKRMVACGFGVGLQWASVFFETRDIVCTPVLTFKQQ